MGKIIFHKQLRNVAMATFGLLLIFVLSFVIFKHFEVKTSTVDKDGREAAEKICESVDGHVAEWHRTFFQDEIFVQCGQKLHSGAIVVFGSYSEKIYK